ncbi:MAG: DUF1761 domain-containing protein [Bacteroidota bacterium]|nr:DUF1761 domain-containing protein [Bacteroidota bacterium]
MFGLSAVYHFIGITALAIFIGQDTTPVGGLLRGLVIGLFWVLTSIGVTYLFAGRSFRLFMIDAGFYIFFYSLAGFILGVW